MKTLYRLSGATMFAFLVMSMVSCSKADLRNPETNSQNQNNVQAGKNNIQVEAADGPTDVIEYGSVRLEVLPMEAKASVTVYSSTYNSGPTYAWQTNGVFTFRNLEVGTYSILIHPNNPNYTDLLIENVTVTANQMIDLGIIGL